MAKAILQILTFIVGMGAWLLRTWAAKWLWKWFAVPALHVAPVSFWTMFGLLTLFGVFKGAGNPDRDPETDTDRKTIASLARVVFLCIAWLVSFTIGWLIMGGHHRG